MKKGIISALLVISLTLSLSACGLIKSDDGVSDGVGRYPDDGSKETASSTKTDVSADPTEVRISFAAAGDNLIHESVYKDAAARATALASSGGTVMDYYFTEMYSEEFRNAVGSADVAFVNQEAPIVPDRKASGYPAFNTPTEAGDALVDMGFDIINMANNHMLDMDGQCEGLRSTIEYWKSKNILPIGAYESEEDFNTIRILESKGKRIAVLAYTYDFAASNGTKLNPKSTDLVIPYINDSDIIDQVSRASELADAVVVSVHWGTENSFDPTSEQERLAKLMSKYGADVVIGHHSHTLQPIKWVENDAGERTLVIYSLGNLISSQMKAHNMVGGLATFELVFAPDGTLTVEKPILVPTITHYSADGNKLDNQGLPTRTNVSVALLEEYNSDKCAAHGAQLPALNGPFTLGTLKGFVTDNIDAEFLPDFLK